MSKNVGIDLADYIGVLDNYVSSPTFLSIFDALSQLIAVKLESNQRFKRTRPGAPAGAMAMENLMWARSLLLNAWVRWIFQSKAISHEYPTPVRNPLDMNILENDIIPTLNDAITQGRNKAIRDKVREGSLESKDWTFESLRAFITENEGKPSASSVKGSEDLRILEIILLRFGESAHTFPVDSPLLRIVYRHFSVVKIVQSGINERPSIQ